jgi:hypothetical protein
MKSKFLLISLAALATALVHSPADAALIFELNGTGTLATVPLSATVQHETITVNFLPTASIDLNTGVLEADFDVTALPNIISGLSNEHFALTSTSGNGLFGDYQLDTTVFSTPLEETVTGTFLVTSDTGLYSGMVGSGTFTGTTIYDNLTLATGTVTFVIDGALDVPEPSTLGPIATVTLGLAILRQRRGRYTPSS